MLLLVGFIITVLEAGHIDWNGEGFSKKSSVCNKCEPYMPNFDNVNLALKATTNSVVTINEIPGVMILYPECHWRLINLITLWYIWEGPGSLL